MSLLTTVQESTKGNYYFSLKDGSNALPAGLVSNKSWAQIGTSGYYATLITLPVGPQYTANTATSVTTQLPAGVTPTADLLGVYASCWVVACYVQTGTPFSQLFVIVAGDPTASTASFGISWAITQL